MVMLSDHDTVAVLLSVVLHTLAHSVIMLAGWQAC